MNRPAIEVANSRHAHEQDYTSTQANVANINFSSNLVISILPQPLIYTLDYCRTCGLGHSPSTRVIRNSLIDRFRVKPDRLKISPHAYRSKIKLVWCKDQIYQKHSFARKKISTNFRMKDLEGRRQIHKLLLSFNQMFYHRPSM